MTSEKNPPEARDADKLVRQLSLVAFLMARNGRPASSETIRWKVEGYGDDDQKWDSFVRRFHADRDELSRLGIEIGHERDPDGEGDIYWLPPENYFLPAVNFSREELAALGACLGLLDGQFAYSRTLKLALLGLALGTGNDLADPIMDSFAVNLMAPGFDDEVARRQKDIDNAIYQRKTIRFDYLALGRDAAEARMIDPYAMMLTRGEWYLIGYSHERQAMRIFKLARMQGKIVMPSKNQNNYEIPADFRAEDYTTLEPWQLGESLGEARIELSPRIGWWAEGNLAHAGRIELSGDDSAMLTTAYSDEQALLSLVLRLYPDARLSSPDDMRKKLRAALESIAAAHQEEATGLLAEAKAAGTRPKTEVADTTDTQVAAITQQVPPERFALMATTISYFIDRLRGQDTVTLPVEEVMRDLGFASRRSLEQAMDMIRLVNYGGGDYLVWPELKGENIEVEGFPESDTFRKPAHLSPREARAMLLAIDLVGSHLLGTQYLSLETVRDKIVKAAGGLDAAEVIAIGETEKEDFQICRVINQGLTDHRLVEIEYLSRDAAAPKKRSVEPYLVIRSGGSWYLVAWCRLRAGIRTFRFDMMRSARLLDEEFQPRDPAKTGLERYRSGPLGNQTPRVAEVWFSPEIACIVAEEKQDVTELADGSLVARIPYFSDNWLIAEVLGYSGLAVLLAPVVMRQGVAAAAAAAAASYE